MAGYLVNHLAEQWLSNSAMDLLGRGAAVAQRFGQRHYRGPQVLLAALEGGLLDRSMLVAGVERRDLERWLEARSRKASGRWGGKQSPSLDTEFSSELEILARRSLRMLEAEDVLGLILEHRIGLTRTELECCPTSLGTLGQAISRGSPSGEPVSDVFPGPRTRVDAVPTVVDPAVLATHAVNLQTQVDAFRVRYGEPTEDVRGVARILGRLCQPNPMIVGQPGVGKSAVVESLAALIASDDAPDWLRGKSIHAIACPGLAARSAQRGQLEELLQQILDVALLRTNVILFFDDIHVLADPVACGVGSLLGLFESYLVRQGFRMIAATTTKDFEAHIRPVTGFLRRFEIVNVEEPDGQRALGMLTRHLPAFRDHYGVEVESDVLEGLVRNSERYVPRRRFPEKAVSLLDRAMQRVREKGDTRLDLGVVLDTVSEVSGIPVGHLSEMEQSKLQGLSSYLDDRIFDQPQATLTVTRAIQSMRVGLQDPKRTGAACLLVGPPGTGKTELAKALAEYLMGSEKALARFNMSEFQTPESYQRLLGPPPGYVGYEAGGELTNLLMNNPYSVVLFDEIEKGSRRVFDVFLQVLSDGHLTDNHGQIVDCKNSVFIMTSNALPETANQSDDEIRRAFLRYADPHQGHGLAPVFRTEFIDRLEIVPFRPLGAATLRRVLRREIDRVIHQFNVSPQTQGNVAMEESAMDWLIARIDVKATGARSVQRLVNEQITRTLAGLAVEGGLQQHVEYSLTAIAGEDRLQLKPRGE